jgi:hypothetical protein
LENFQDKTKLNDRMIQFDAPQKLEFLEIKEAFLSQLFDCKRIEGEY